MAIQLSSGSFLESACRIGLHNISIMGLDSGWSISFWCKPDLSTSSNNAYFFVKEAARYYADESTPCSAPYSHGYTNREFYFNKLTNELTGIVYRGSGGSDNATTIITIDPSSINNQWTHLLFSFDTTNGIKIYLNGILSSGVTNLGTGTLYTDSYSEGLGVNKWRFFCKGPDGINDRMNGGLSELTIWGRILSDAEILSLATNKNSLEIVPSSTTETWEYDKKSIPQETNDLAVWRLLNNNDLSNYSEYVISDLNLNGSITTLSGPIGFDYNPPTVSAVSPVSGEISPPINSISITFNEVVRGLTVYHGILAEQLIVNGNAATNITGSGSGPYVFSGFNFTSGSISVQLLGSGDGINDISGNRLVDSNWNYILSHTISVSASPAGGGNVTGGGIYNNGSTAIVVATYNLNYKFINWTENGIEISTNASYSFVINADRNLIANFVQSYLITTSSFPIEGGSITGGGFYTNGSVVILIATRNIGYVFNNWTENGVIVSNNAIYGFLATDNRTLMAHFIASEVVDPNVSVSGEDIIITDSANNLFNKRYLYNIRNNDSVIVNYNISSQNEWLTISNGSGELQPNTDVNIVVVINSRVKKLSGKQIGQLIFDIQ